MLNVILFHSYLFNKYIRDSSTLRAPLVKHILVRGWAWRRQPSDVAGCRVAGKRKDVALLIWDWKVITNPWPLKACILGNLTQGLGIGRFVISTFFLHSVDCASWYSCVMTNKMRFFYYSNNHLLHVSNRLTIHHQEVAVLYMQHVAFIMHLRWLVASTIGVLAASQHRCMMNTTCCMYSKATSWLWIFNLFETCRWWLLK